MNAGGRITLSMPDHAPYAHAFDELALLIFIELLEEAAGYLDAFARADDTATSSATMRTRRATKRRREAGGEADAERRKAMPTNGPPGSGSSTWPWPPASCCGRRPTAGSCFASG